VTIAIRPSDERGTALIMLLIWGRVKRHSENQNRPTATEWHDGQIGHGGHPRFARRATVEFLSLNRGCEIGHIALRISITPRCYCPAAAARDPAGPHPLVSTVNHRVCAAAQDRFARHPTRST
jgi:hypothetical protein